MSDDKRYTDSELEDAILIDGPEADEIESKMSAEQWAESLLVDRLHEARPLFREIEAIYQERLDDLQSQTSRAREDGMPELAADCILELGQVAWALGVLRAKGCLPEPGGEG